MNKDFVKFRLRDRKDGVKSIFLSYYYRGKRHEESLRLYLIPELTKEDKKKNKETWKIAEIVKSRRLTEMQENKFSLNKSKKIYLLELWQEKINKANSFGNKCTMKSAYRQMYTYLNGKDILLEEIDFKFVEGFVKFLNKGQTNFKYLSSTLKPNSQSLYFSKFRTIIKEAYRHKLINDDPCVFVKLPKVEEAERTYLTLEELNAVVDTPCPIENIKTCFLFSCLTGLRRSDIMNLTWDQVSNINGLTRLTFRQQKTKGLQYLDINEQAARLMGERKKKNKDYVFPRLPSHECTNNYIRNWAAAAGITKKLTFHSGRHTFATLMITLDTDLYTVSKLLGHSDIRTTQIYAKVLDRNRQDAIKKIPDLHI
jgi:integrase